MKGTRREGFLQLLVVALVVGLALGALSVFGEGPGRPRSLVLIANLVSPWGLGAFLVGRRSWSARAGAVAGGLTLLLGMATFYALTDASPYVRSARDIVWTLTAVVVGPILGACAARSMSPIHRSRVIASVIPASMFLAESAWLVVERRAWAWDLGLEPHRWVDVLVIVSLMGAAFLTPRLILGGGERPSWLYPAIVGSGLAGGATLWLLHRILLLV